jgi:hypothetical protein
VQKYFLRAANEERNLFRCIRRAASLVCCNRRRGHGVAPDERNETVVRATQIVDYLGKETPSCDDHAKQLKSFMRELGFPFSSTPSDDGMPCFECWYNERKLLKQKENVCLTG